MCKCSSSIDPQVCRWWREVGEAPQLWAKIRVLVTPKNIMVMPTLLSTSRRLESLIDLFVHTHSKELLEAVAIHTSLKKISLATSKEEFTAIEPEVVARAVGNVEDVTIIGQGMKNKQWEAVFKVMGSGVTNTEKLSLHMVDIIPMKSALNRFTELLLSAVGNLENLKMTNVELTVNQLASIFKLIAGQSRLRTLEITDQKELSYLEPDLVARAVNNLEEVELCYYAPLLDMNLQQVEEIVFQSGFQTSLKRLRVKKIGKKVDHSLHLQAQKYIECVQLTAL